MFRIWACTETSSALVGSSRTMNSGRRESARAIPMPLALTAGELVGEPPFVLRVEPDLAEEVRDASVPLRARPGVVDRQRFRDDVPDEHARAQRAERVLEDDLQLPADLPHLPPRSCGRASTGPRSRRARGGRLSSPRRPCRRCRAAPASSCAVEGVEARRCTSAGRAVERVPRGRLDETEEEAADRRLAAAGLADEPDRLAVVDVEADAIDGPDVADVAREQAAADREVLTEVVGRR